MKITLLCIGKTEDDYIKKGIDKYFKRLKHYLTFKMEIIPGLKNTKNISEDLQKEKEGELILAKISPTDHVVLLDEKGIGYNSIKFAEQIEKKMVAGTRSMVFVIGGPYGFSHKVYQRANEKTALSPMTFSHQMVRLVFVEQLYRAMTIIRGEPYHHQ
ncbi:MAG: 23S rRNA (pseudouridine(1915)-N(3))-methyltransferase RlmH [Prolixibacteraceae bacterium]|jgi:23S rRNA (pseudouridine1915-N3)-methyltransferase|nr:23S rRNA (pseudouridine(1915)-N(3))-methyltransferase RlmH [Prolixibacteraceae bacterium]